MASLGSSDVRGTHCCFPGHLSVRGGIIVRYYFSGKKANGVTSGPSFRITHMPLPYTIQRKLRLDLPVSHLSARGIFLTPQSFPRFERGDTSQEQENCTDNIWHNQFWIFPPSHCLSTYLSCPSHKESRAPLSTVTVSLSDRLG